MLVALVMSMFLGGGGAISGGVLSSDTVKQLSKHMQAVVEDEDRAVAVADSLAELRAEIKRFEKRFAQSGKELTAVYKDHDAGVDEMMAVLDALNEDWAESQRRVIELRFEALESMTREEWTAAFQGGQE